ncbi:MAG: GTP 3',8-cyclase MoaA [Gammaproteobacteria bacterium]
MRVLPTDVCGRHIRDLRISVTDRCNFRCIYCMPKATYGAGYPFLARRALLSFEEIARIARVLIAMGVRKIRLTGGEPLLRRELERLVEMLAALPGLSDLSLTTNGACLTRAKARALRDAGLKRLTLSLDALDDQTFRAMNDVGFPVSRVEEALSNAANVGFPPAKINMVVKRGVNDHSIVPMARRFRGTGHIVRFIEYMDVGKSNGWRLDEVVAGAEIVDSIHREWPLAPVSPNYPGEVASRWKYQDGQGEIGIITSVTQPFCGNCTRVRLSAEGRLYTCLFASAGHDLRYLVRGGAADDYIAQAIAAIWSRRHDRYSERRSAETAALPRIEMSYIGG